MPSFQDARRIILENVAPLGSENVSALDAAGRVLAEPVTATCDLPRWNNSAMDGFAVRADEAGAPEGLRVSDYVPAGATPQRPLAPGTAARVLTGAPIPPGADAVVPFEDADEREGVVRPRKPVRAGSHVRRQGEDIRAGEAILAAGAVVGPAEIAALVAASRLVVAVVRRPRVAILSTGDELVDPGAPLAPGLIHDSNAWSLAAAVGQLGAIPDVLGVARDDRADLRRRLGEGILADALVTSAGVSMGDRDLVREALDALSARQLFWKVDVKPGRPTAFALAGRTPVFSLPGNPVATLLTFDQFVRPALLKMMGHARVLRPLVPARLRDGIARKPGRVELVRVRLAREGGALVASSAGDQATGMLKTLLRADGVVVVPADRGALEPGAIVDVQVLRGELEPWEA